MQLWTRRAYQCSCRLDACKIQYTWLDALILVVLCPSYDSSLAVSQVSTHLCVRSTMHVM